MKNIPEKIYLQLGFKPGEQDDFKDCHEVTWHSERIFDTDIEYTLAKPERKICPKCGGEGWIYHKDGDITACKCEV